MSTYANVVIEGRCFSVSSDGGDKESIKEAVKGYVAGIKKRGVKPEYLVLTVLDTITADSATDYYAQFTLGCCEFPSYIWTIKIGVRGGVKITGGKVEGN